MKKQFTDLAKAAYLACSHSIKWVSTEPPIDYKSKSTFILEAPSENFFDFHETCWGEVGSHSPKLENAKKYFYKIQQMRRRAIELAQKKRSKYRSIITCGRCNRKIYNCTIDKKFFTEAKILDKTCFSPTQKAYGYPRFGDDLRCPACQEKLYFKDLILSNYIF